MLVKNWMSKEVITIDVNDSIQHAGKLMKEHSISRLPVMKKGELVGIFTDRDLKGASASDVNDLEIHEPLYLSSIIKVGGIMSKDPITVPPDYTLEETAEILLNNRISGAPVVEDDGQVVGMITSKDLFRAMVPFTGVGKRGFQFGFLLEDRPGSIKEAVGIIREYGGRIVSIMSTWQRAPKGYRRVNIRTYGISRLRIDRLTANLDSKTTLLYVIDHRENKREIFDNECREHMQTAVANSRVGKNEGIS
jgi:acetoin utilization protein AcuB